MSTLETSSTAEIPAITSRKQIDGLAPKPYLYLAAVLFALIYIPVLIETANTWMTDENYSHGFLVIPCSLYLLWLSRRRLHKATIQPNGWGLVLVFVGLSIQVGSWILNIVHIGLWSMILTLVGMTLVFFGPEVWRISRFPILFLIFAAPLSQFVQGKFNHILQSISTYCSTSLLSSLGFILTTHGNIIELPGGTLEVANACSGFNKCISMLTFATLYGYLVTTSYPKRILLMAAALPIALAANIFRICVLCAATTYGGISMFHLFHDPAEYAAIIFAFAGLAITGRILRCDPLRLAQPLAA